jgi:hypothetical protein
MRENMPGRGVETKGNGALHCQETPSWPAMEGAQITLGSPDAKCLQAASRMGALLKEAQVASDFTLGTVGRLAGKETPYVSKCFDIEDPHSVLKMVAGIILLDTSRVWLRGVNAMAGCDLVERQHITDAEFRRRVESKARHGKADSAWLEEALEEKP